MPTSLIVLAAGKGTRMQSDLPKVLHKLAQAPLLAHALASGAVLAPERVIVVAGHKAETVEAAVSRIAPQAQTVRQDGQHGTAHAVLAARAALQGAGGDAVVLYGDTPFIQPATLRAMGAARAQFDVVVLGFEAAEPGGYGRLITEGDALLRIVEAAEATDEERAVTLCNSGVICADAATLMDLAAAVGNDNSKGEYYLTDIVAIARERGLSAGVVRCAEAETLGINTRAELAAAEAAFQARTRARLAEAGVAMQAPDTVIFAQDTAIAPGAEIEPYVVFAPGVTIEAGARIRAFSHLEGAHVGPDAVVGPYARLRPGADLAEGAKIGNFVEVKGADIGPGAKVNHLTYIGDAAIGAGANIGAGSVTCNYDGFAKHRTEIGAGAFVGSGTLMVAPVSIGAGAVTGSGSVITEDVPDEALALGRARQVTKPGMGARLMDLFRKRAGKG